MKVAIAGNAILNEVLSLNAQESHYDDGTAAWPASSMKS